MWNDGDLSSVDEILGSEWIDHAHPERKSPKDVQEAVALARAERPDTRVLVDAILGEGELITVNGRIEADGRIESRVWMVRVSDNQLQEMWTYSDD